jgi:hypothetical protein
MSEEIKLRATLALISGMSRTDGKPSTTDYAMLNKIHDVAERILAGGELYPVSQIRKLDSAQVPKEWLK